MSTGLYIHVPFCVRKCPYCDFYSVSQHSDEVFRSYTDAVVRNINRYISDDSTVVFDTVYFGGGTPSLMPSYFYRDVLGAAVKNLSGNPEITMELNPKTADRRRLSEIRKYGVNRISAGIQSASDTELKYLGRIHNYAEAVKAVEDIRSAGFENISGDLMIGVKGQNETSLVSSVNSLADLELNHISSYMLKIEAGTEYSRNGIESEVPDEDKTADMYLLAVKTLAERGYSQYEISNFSKPGYESRHNLKYWKSEDYIGIGPSAHSCYRGKRYEVPRSLTDFISSELQNETVNEENPGDFFEKAMLRLRLSEGISRNEFPEEFPLVLKQAERFRNSPLLNLSSDRISFTAEGFLISNYLISELLSDF